MAPRTIKLKTVYTDIQANELNVLEPLPTQRPLGADYVADLEHSVRQHFQIPVAEGLQYWLENTPAQGEWSLVHPSALEGGNTYTVSWAAASAQSRRYYCAVKAANNSQQGFAVVDVHGRVVDKDGLLCIDLDIGLEVGPYGGKLAQSRVELILSTQPEGFTIYEANPLNESQMLSISSTKSSSITAGIMHIGAGISAIGPHPVPVVNLSYSRGQQQVITANVSSVWDTGYDGSCQLEGKVKWIMHMTDAGYKAPYIPAEATYGFAKRFSAVILSPVSSDGGAPSPVTVRLTLRQRCNALSSNSRNVKEIKSTKEISQDSVFEFDVGIHERPRVGACPGWSKWQLHLDNFKGANK